MITKESAFQKISELVDRFTDQYESYIKGDYNETQTRRDFIDPFFKALGWDIDNEQGYAEAYREVIHEDKVKVGSATKAPDYSFRLVGGKRLFFVEAKKPSIVVKDDIIPAYQIRRYGWSAKLSISIITDFQEFAVYDCTKKPNPTDKASVSRIKYITFKEYLQEFDFIYDTFSKERVLKGSFDKFVLGTANKKGTATVDKEFLQSLDKWRTYLATSISLNNKDLGEDEINFAVQQTIDRIIFLRIAEDRGVEHYGNLKNAFKQGVYYQNLFSIFKEADEKYNSGIFDFKKDHISKNLKIDNKVIKTIVNELYYPESPYEFSVLSVEILGSAYEQFLGKVIRITPGHHAKVEEKPEVRKAGGVYYTPQYIVEYIVKNTVGKLIDGKTPKEISNIRIVDPACGSGSFLIGSFQYLLDYHKNYYSDNGKPSKGKKDNTLTPEGNLTSNEKKRILLNNIYGVDIDLNAVEVTKLSLLLKCMEGETQASIGHQMSIFKERVLPTLDDNIKSGNSLIDTDFYDTKLDFGEEKKIKPFNWVLGFSDVFKQGGFDIVIGNPPYVFGRDWKVLGITEDVKKYLRSHYKSSSYQLDMFSIFMEKSFKLIKENGYCSFIVPNVWLNNTYSSLTRRFILENSFSLNITIPLKKVFEGITVDTVIFISQKGKPEKGNHFIINSLTKLEHNLIQTLETDKYISGELPISASVSNIEITLLNKIRSHGKPLSYFADITRGVHPYRIGGYGESAFTKGHQIQKDVDERPYHSKIQLKDYRPFIYGKDLKRFTTLIPNEYIKYGKWLAEPRDPKYFEGDRIYSRKILGDKLVLTIEKENSIADQQVYITIPKSKKIKIEFFAAILGSKLMAFYIKKYFNETNDDFPQIKVGQLKSLPFIEIDIYIQNQVIEEIVQDINLISKLKEGKMTSKLQSSNDQIQAKIDYYEEKINQAVYKLYDLKEEEIKIIEQG